MFSARKIYWDLSQTQHTPAGDVLMRLYYNTDLSHMLEGSCGYPHNGGQHTLHARTTISELKSWLDLVRSDMGAMSDPFINAINCSIKNYMERYYEAYNG